MRKVGPYGVETLPQVCVADRSQVALVDVPAAPAACRGALVERARLHWSRGDGGDPAALAEEFLAAHGLPL
ncbi:hypothetical protein DDE19_27250, partial [Micromonospora ureilytica]